MRLKRISGHIVDVLNRRHFLGTLAIKDGRIVSIKKDSKVRNKQLIMPGFVDAHIHIESSLLPPAEFARLAVVHGTVATVSDPHEIANVLGVKGVKYMVKEGKSSLFNFSFGAPPCVPATSFETAGARMLLKDVKFLLKRKDIDFLSEVMNFPGVLNKEPDLLEMIAYAQSLGKPVDGHAPGLRGLDVIHYASTGITTDHECVLIEEAKEKLKAGMKILIREGSAARNFDALIGLLKTDAKNCMFCCDDLHPDILVQSHIDSHIRRALDYGLDPFDVLSCASVNPIKHYGLKVGLLQEGDFADFVIVDSLEHFKVQATYLKGKLVAKQGKSLLPHRKSRVINIFKTGKKKAEDFRLSYEAGKIKVMQAIDGKISTTSFTTRPKVSDGFVVTDPTKDILKLAVINRYSKNKPVSIGFIRGFGLSHGAIASSVAHDSHNIIVVGVTDEAMADAANLVIANRGGLSVVGKNRSEVLPLPIAGLMATERGEKVAKQYLRCDALSKRLGSLLRAPFMTLSFMALLVIPDLKLSDKGLFSGKKWTFESLFTD
jgi:adenine deaminase